MKTIDNRGELSNLVCDHFDRKIFEARPVLLEIAEAFAVLRAEKYANSTLSAFLNDCERRYGLPSALILELNQIHET